MTGGSEGRQRARVVLRDTARRAPDATRWEAASDSAGRFRVAGLRAGTLRLEVTRDRYEPAGFEVRIAPAVTVDVRIRLVVDELWVLTQRAADSLEAADRAAIAAVRRGVPAGVAAAPPEPPAVRLTGERPPGDGTSLLPPLAGGLAPAAGPTRNLLTGRVRTPDGQPVGRVQLQAMGSTLLTLTDSLGQFRFRDLPPGPYFIRARKVGYEPVVFTATLRAVDSLDAAITLTPLVGVGSTRLDTMRVTAEYDRLSRRLRGFNARKATLRGLYIDRAEIAMRRPQLLSDLLRGRPNITVQRNNEADTQIFGPRLSISSGYCPMALILDGTLIPTVQGRIDAVVPIDMVAGIEVYPTGTSVPSEFARPETDCGVVIVWTR